MPREQDHARSGIEQAARVVARALVVGGGLFWVAAAFSGPFAYAGTPITESLKVATGPLIAAVVILLIAWADEHLAAVLLLAGSAAVAVWGTLYQWEAGLWLVMGFVLIAPMVTAAFLFLLSAYWGARIPDTEPQVPPQLARRAVPLRTTQPRQAQPEPR